MKASLPIFLALISLTFGHVLPSTKREVCQDQGPETYCMSTSLAKHCRKTEFCEHYLNKLICEQGPESYCKTREGAVICDQEALCLTWPDDSVTAIKVVDDQTLDLTGRIFERHGSEINMYGIPIYT